MNAPIELYRRLRPGAGAALSVLIFHRVVAEPDPMLHDVVDAAAFDRQMALLRRCFTPLGLVEAIERLASDSLPARACCVTFDDGYADNLKIALPILQRHGIPMTVFVATGFLDGGRMWNDTVMEAVRRAPAGVLDLDDCALGRHEVDGSAGRRAVAEALIGRIKYLEPAERAAMVDRIASRIGADLPDDLMLATHQVLEMYRAGVEIGGHTMNHPILATLDDDAARTEIADGKRQLEEIVGERLRVFAYPNGKPGEDYAARHVAMVREAGFLGAVSTAWGAASKGTDLHQIPRFTPWDRGSARFLFRLLANVGRAGETA